MPKYPSGTVTFLFSDIEGSTRLWEQHPTAMKRALERHDELMRASFETQHGYIFKTMGDAFCVAFQTASDAIMAALQAQQALIKESWGETRVRVRMGLHTGEANERSGDYFGPTLNRTARMMAIGHGGQVLLSGSTKALVQDALPRGASLQELGLHRLKDLSRPEDLFQLCHPDLERDFAPLKSLGNMPNNLPRQMTSFIGREQELEEVKQLIREAPLVTLVGIGGTGKSRLAMHVAADLIEEYADGVWLVELAPITDPKMVALTLADTMQVKDETGRGVVEALQAALKRRRMLLVLDNCEHLLEAASRLAAELLSVCPNLQILASSRQALEIEGENIYALAPLSLPAFGNKNLAELRRSESVQLFVERAKSVKHGFELSAENGSAVAAICRKLDGIPLALELAAARMQVMTTQKLAEMLDDRFRLLTGGKRTALPRHQTLRAMIDWSYDLLTPPEQKLLQRLSIFSGGFSLEAVEAVCAGDGIEGFEVIEALAQLGQKSLVVMDELDGDSRYRLLETVREYAREKLAECREEESVQQAHSAYFLKLGEESEEHLSGQDQVIWVHRLEKEHDNMRAALGWFLGSGKSEEALRLGSSLGRFWMMHSHLSEGREWMDAVINQSPSAKSKIEAKALRWAAILAWTQGDHQSSKRLARQSLEISRELGDKDGMAAALNSLGIVTQEMGDFREARQLLQESLALHREMGNRWRVGQTLVNLGIVAQALRDFSEARLLYEESLAISLSLQDKRSTSLALNGLALVLYTQGDLVAARRFLEESLAISRELGDKSGMAIALSGLAGLLQAEGQEARSARVQGCVRTLLDEIHAPLERLDQKYFDETAQANRAALGEDSYKVEFEAGRGLTLEEAAELALQKR